MITSISLNAKTIQNLVGYDHMTEVLSVYHSPHTLPINSCIRQYLFPYFLENYFVESKLSVDYPEGELSFNTWYHNKKKVRMVLPIRRSKLDESSTSSFRNIFYIDECNCNLKPQSNDFIGLSNRRIQSTYNSLI